MTDPETGTDFELAVAARVPSTSPETTDLIREIRNRDGVKGVDGLMRDPDVVTEKQVARAASHEKIPGWMAPFLPDLLAHTLGHLAGVRLAGGPRCAIYVFDGIEFTGVHDAFEPWLTTAPSPFRENDRARALRDDTHATRLSVLTKSLLAGRLVRPYSRDATPPGQLVLDAVGSSVDVDGDAWDGRGRSPDAKRAERELYERYADG